MDPLCRVSISSLTALSGALTVVAVNAVYVNAPVANDTIEVPAHSCVEGKRLQVAACTQNGTRRSTREGVQRSRLVSRIGDITVSAYSRHCEPARLTYPESRVSTTGALQGKARRRAVVFVNHFCLCNVGGTRISLTLIAQKVKPNHGSPVILTRPPISHWSIERRQPFGEHICNVEGKPKSGWQLLVQQFR